MRISVTEKSGPWSETGAQAPLLIFNLLSANAFSLAWSKSLSCGNGLTLCQTHWTKFKVFADDKLNATTMTFFVSEKGRKHFRERIK